jgi:uncharacterized membrane protein YphA (DoxX/SURF4 family)
MARVHRLLTWPAALYIAGILLWYEHEKVFRLFVASVEITAAVLVLIPYTRMWGAALASGVMSGAIFFHLVSPLGIDPYNDGGALFKEACAVWLSAAFILSSYRAEIRTIIASLLNRASFASP